MENIFNIKESFHSFKKRLPLIIMTTLLFIALSGILSYTIMKPVYEASTQILINQNLSNSQEFSAQDIDANIQLISTYNVIMKSPAILVGVIEELNLNETVNSLNERITVSSIENSQVVTLNVEDASMEQAVLIANTTARVFQNEIQELMKVDNVNILALASIPVDPEPIRPNPLFNMGIGAVMGFLIGTGLAILLDQMNTTIRREEDIEEIIGLQVLGIVSSNLPNRKEKKKMVIRKKGLKNDVGIEKNETASEPKIGRSY